MNDKPRSLGRGGGQTYTYLALIINFYSSNNSEQVMFLFCLGKFFHAFPRLAEFSQGRGRRIPWKNKSAILKYKASI